MSHKLNFCTKHGTSYVKECHQCYREATECEHGVAFDGICLDCINKDSKAHPLKNPDSKHYGMVDGIEAVDRLEQMYSREDLMAWAKISAMKYRLRIGHKDEVAKEAKKIATFEAYYKHLEAMQDE